MVDLDKHIPRQIARVAVVVELQQSVLLVLAEMVVMVVMVLQLL
jgi:hypothetical protein